jgi:Terminase RNaseH-like domain
MEISLNQMRRVVIAVDPATTSGDNADETGIIVVAAGPHIELPHASITCRVGNCNKHGYVLDDRSGRYSTDAWARIVKDLFDKWGADRIVAEGNQGGEMVEAVIRTVFPSAPIKRVHARQGKRTRAEPVAALYEQGRIHHVGAFPVLEDQLTSWTVDSGESPDRLDALVWGIVELGLTNFGGGKQWLESLAPPCNECGQPNPPESMNCSKCGAELIASVPSDAPLIAQEPFGLTSGGIARINAPNPQNQIVMDLIRQHGPQQWSPFNR